MSDIDLFEGVAYIILVALAYWHGHKTGVTAGAANMYEHLYKQGTRKNDIVIVELEYEERTNSKEF